MLYFVERELLGDQVRRLVWQAYLRMANLPFTNEIAPNADYMSPTGRYNSGTVTTTVAVFMKVTIMLLYLLHAYPGRAPFLCMNLSTQPVVFSDFDKLVSFLEVQVGFLV